MGLNWFCLECGLVVDKNMFCNGANFRSHQAASRKIQFIASELNFETWWSRTLRKVTLSLLGLMLLKVKLGGFQKHTHLYFVISKGQVGKSKDSPPSQHSLGHGEAALCANSLLNHLELILLGSGLAIVRQGCRPDY